MGSTTTLQELKFIWDGLSQKWADLGVLNHKFEHRQNAFFNFPKANAVQKITFFLATKYWLGEFYKQQYAQ